jgi:hypothetical protein
MAQETGSSHEHYLVISQPNPYTDGIIRMAQETMVHLMNTTWSFLNPSTDGITMAPETVHVHQHLLVISTTKPQRTESHKTNQDTNEEVIVMCSVFPRSSSSKMEHVSEMSYGMVSFVLVN